MTWEIKQRVNFYLEEFQPPKIPNDLRQLIISVIGHAVIAMVVLVGLSINWYWQGLRMEKVAAQQVVVESQVNNIERERPPLKINQELTKQRDDMRADLDSSQRILRYLTQQELSSSDSFTTLVTGLGKQDVAGVWLKRFAFYREGKHISLEGSTDDPAKVSRYVSSLLKRDGFEDHAFRFVDIYKQEDSAWLSFKLDSRPQEVTKDSGNKTATITSKELMRQAREGRL
jgi:hypothetical protein